MFFEEFLDRKDSFLALSTQVHRLPCKPSTSAQKEKGAPKPSLLGFQCYHPTLLVAAAVVAGLRGEGLPFLFGQFFLYDRGTLEFVRKNRLHQIAAIHCLRCQKH